MAADTSLVFNILAKDRASEKFKKVGAAAKVALAAAGIAAVKFGADSIKAASDLAETTSKIGELFGGSASDIQTWSKKASTSMGQSQQQAMDAAASFAIMGKSAGLSGKDLVKFSTDFTGLASDLASFNNTSPEDAIDAISSALRGEAEPLRKYGVLLDDASMRQEALKLGLIKTTKQALTPQQKVLAAQALIYKQTTAAQGDFARTSDGLANKQRILSARLEDTKTKVGQKLLPAMLAVITAFSKTADFIERNSRVILPLVAGLGGLALAVWAVNKAAKAYAAVQAALNIVLSANPIGLVVLAIAALVGGLVIAYKKSATFRAVVQGAFKTVATAGKWMWENVLRPAFHGIAGGIKVVAAVVKFHIDIVKGIFNGIKTIIGNVVGWFKDLPGQIGNAFRNIGKFILYPFKAAFNAVAGLWNNTIGAIGFTFPDWVPGLGGKSFNVPDIPLMANGGIVRHTPGGTAAILGEGRRDEAVIPLPRGGRGLLGGGVVEVHLTADEVMSALMRGIRKEVRTKHGGNVQSAFGT